MKELKEIKKELLEIRHYYSNIKGKCSGEKIGVVNNIEERVAKYNEAVKNAPLLLYELYCAMYIEGNTIEALADKWCFNYTTILRRHLKLVKYFQSVID